MIVARGMGDGDVADTITSVANTISGGEIDRVSAQIDRISTLGKVAVVASYIAGALAVAALVKGK